MAIYTGSESETLRVRLLSSAQARQAPTIAAEPGKFTTGEPSLRQRADLAEHHMHNEQSDTRPAIKDAGEHPGIGSFEEEFRHGRREPKRTAEPRARSTAGRFIAFTTTREAKPDIEDAR